MANLETEEKQNRRVFRGWATVAIKDSEGELIPMETLREKMDVYFRRGAPIMLNHSNWMVGRGLDYEFRMNDEAKAEGVYITGEVFNDFPIDNDVWGAMQEGELNEMSLAGQFEMGDDGVADWAAPMEVSLTGEAVDSKAINPKATVEEISRAKSRAYKTIMGDRKSVV